MRSPKIIIDEMKVLLNELSSFYGAKSFHGKAISQKSKSIALPKGALGAINTLINEKFFDVPREISVVMERLKEIGHYHKRTAIAMNLLNLTKRRALNRFKNKETKNWEYVIRK